MATLSASTCTDVPLQPSPKSTLRGQTPAVRRLMWDWKELRADPLDHVVAAPLEDNMLEWHVNLIGPAELSKMCPEVEMAQSVWHMVIRFSDFYPARPPSVVLCTSIPGHLNVLGARPRDGLFPVCMDMLETGNLKQTSTHQYTGWSSAYTVRSILMQLQALLWHRDIAPGPSHVSASRGAVGIKVALAAVERKFALLRVRRSPAMAAQGPHRTPPENRAAPAFSLP
ncbi:hypothetical protein AMAG_17651 [Allomyces macrogynus ATCC 38327]|uniref:UBC core domain-containing protein n=1 Tax=Allomyces macrogynus (strain ATCC 38327) TaxID=578462 RepID=A0A0L0RW38_ALLM3|nr:hypothetical protein AMAG_17651 [Allomyces macrogynus ATCC 38327]|eukprot:KNE54310.1 hypothetical protein AMAG_17651 [Allomyces macrogynus ATCC 38327]